MISHLFLTAFGTQQVGLIAVLVDATICLKAVYQVKSEFVYTAVICHITGCEENCNVEIHQDESK